MNPEAGRPTWSGAADAAPGTDLEALTHRPAPGPHWTRIRVDDQDVLTLADLPPLRDRREDIPVLVDYFVRKHQHRTGKRMERVDDDAIAVLQQYDWPGNVRELENVIERAIVLSTGPVITARAIGTLGGAPAAPGGVPSLKLHQNLEWTERETIRRALEASGGVKKDAAELMGISQRALSYYLAKYKID